MAHRRLQAIRERYGLRCGYCGVTEEDSGGELTIDHFIPVSAGGDDSDANLVYACVRCNQYKGALLPEGTDSAHEHRLLHPLLDDIAAHLLADETTGELKALTETGRFHIAALRLNRPRLVANRQRRNLIALLQERSDELQRENAKLREQVAEREVYIAHLEAKK